MDEAVCTLMRRAGPSIGEDHASRDLRKNSRLNFSLVSPLLASPKKQGHVNDRPAQASLRLSGDTANISNSYSARTLPRQADIYQRFYLLVVQRVHIHHTLNHHLPTTNQLQICLQAMTSERT